ncbi:MAG: LacI family DNA-binding transcriptional regulator [Victivallaceae bacterium]|nr:LacI family DNA-binding transcriptional regulator [Victivallaceae bacterium]
MTPTLKTVAQEANVSVSLVSQYLSGSPAARMKAETKKRIDQAVAHLNYRPSAIARSLRQGRSHTIGMPIANLRNRYFATIADLVLAECNAHGYQLLMGYCGDGRQSELAATQMLLDRRVDGMFLLLSQEALQSTHIPAIAFDFAQDAVLCATRDYRDAFRAALSAQSAKSCTLLAPPCNDWNSQLSEVCLERSIPLDIIEFDFAQINDKSNFLRENVLLRAPETIFCRGWASAAALIHFCREKAPDFKPRIITDAPFFFPELCDERIAGTASVDLALFVHRCMEELIAEIERGEGKNFSSKARYFPAADFAKLFPEGERISE